MSLLSGKELELRTVSVSPEQLVLVKNHLEASEGLGYLVAQRGGDAILVAHESRKAELDHFISDLERELGLRTEARPSHESALREYAGMRRTPVKRGTVSETGESEQPILSRVGRAK